MPNTESLLSESLLEIPEEKHSVIHCIAPPQTNSQSASIITDESNPNMKDSKGSTKASVLDISVTEELHV